MIRSTLLLLALGSLAPALPAALPPTATAPALQERKLKDSDLADLAKKLGEWLEASTEKKKVNEAQQAVKDSLDKLEKKLKADPLSFPAEIGAALYMSYDYKKARVVKGKVDLMEGNVLSTDYKFAISAPASYNAAKASLPMILCIPDEKQDPKALLLEDWTSQEVREGAILVAPPMPQDFALWTKSTGPDNEPGGYAFVMATMAKVRDLYAIDFDRIYLVGRGRGAEAAMAIAEQAPDRFAGVIGRAGGPGDVQPDNFSNLPTLFSGGDAKASDFEKKAKELGLSNVTLMPEGKELDFWGWMQQTRRAPNPQEVTLVPGSPFPKRAYWIEVPPLDDASRSARVKARVERETNTIRIEARGVREVILYFSDELVNLSEPVKVVINGTENKDLIPRNFLRTLELIYYARSDPGRIYVETKTYNVPAPDEEGK